MSDEWGPEDIAKLDASFNTPVTVMEALPPVKVTNEQGKPRYFNLVVEEVSIFHGTKFQSTEPEDSFSFVLRITDEDYSKVKIFHTCPMKIQRNLPTYKKAPNEPNKTLDLIMKCGFEEPKMGENFNVKTLVGKELEGELELKPNGYPKIAKLFLKK